MYGRNSAGKYELDVGALRTAFTLSKTVSDRIRDFRTDRLGKIYGGETPVPLRQGGRLVLHLLPLSAFMEHTQIDLSAFDHPDRMILPMGGSMGLDWHLRSLNASVECTQPHVGATCCEDALSH